MQMTRRRINSHSDTVLLLLFFSQLKWLSRTRPPSRSSSPNRTSDARRTATARCCRYQVRWLLLLQLRTGSPGWRCFVCFFDPVLTNLRAFYSTGSSACLFMHTLASASVWNVFSTRRQGQLQLGESLKQ